MISRRLLTRSLVHMFTQYKGTKQSFSGGKKWQRGLIFGKIRRVCLCYMKELNIMKPLDGQKNGNDNSFNAVKLNKVFNARFIWTDEHVRQC